MKKKVGQFGLGVVLVPAVGFMVGLAQADTFSDAVTGGKAYGDFRLRYETVDQDNTLKDAEALTLRSRLGYTTGQLSGFSATLEFEDTRVVAGIDSYNSLRNGKDDFSVIADPASTELDQGFVRYQGSGVDSKLGRQVIKYDNVRFVGDVGWRQDRQTFDAFTFDYAFMEGLDFHYNYMGQRNLIAGDENKVVSDDNLFNLSYKTGFGTAVAYTYLLEKEDGPSNSLDTYGLRFSGGTEGAGVKWLYEAEYATQENKLAGVKNDADYMHFAGGVDFTVVTVKAGYEVLGSDKGEYGFSTPLGTNHKFNGWADQFLTTPGEGLKDAYASVSGKLFGGGWAIVYHDFEADKSSPTPGEKVDNLGSEWDLSYTRAFAKHYKVGVKYAACKAGDIDAGKVDTDKLWLTRGAKF